MSIFQRILWRKVTLTIHKKTKNIDSLQKLLVSLIEDEPNQIANLSNAAALLNQHLDRINWAGFYLLEKDTLVLGPFQGLPACVRIPLGKGVCGTAALKRETIVVPNVHEFPGHIACDQASRSEIVVPMIKNNELIGVLDIDSPEENRFDAHDTEMLEQFVAILIDHL